MLHTHLPILRGGAWLEASGLIGRMRPLAPAAAWHLGDRLTKTAEGPPPTPQPRLSSRRSERATLDLHVEPGARKASPSCSALPSASALRSKPEVLSGVTLTGDGQGARTAREDEALAEGESTRPEYTARCGTGVVKRHSCWD